MIKTILGFLLIFQVALLADFKDVDVDDLSKLMQKNVPVIDIRTPSEWKQTGVIKGAKKIMFFDERGRYDIDKWMSQFSKVVKDKNQPFVLVCRTASRTKMVGRFLSQQMGYKNVLELKGGITNWLRHNKEVVK